MLVAFRYSPPIKRNVLPNKRVTPSTSPVLSGTHARLLAAKINAVKRRGSQVSYPYHLKSLNLTKYGGWGGVLGEGAGAIYQKAPGPLP
jgi:hypothetical protein